MQSFQAKFVRRAVAMAVMTGMAASALAAPPDAGQSIREIESTRPALPPADNLNFQLEKAATPKAAVPAGEKIQVSTFAISGNSAIASDVLQAALADLKDRALTLAELQSAADRVTQAYRKQGFVLARAYLPAQEVDAGVVRIVVLEGRFGAVTVSNQSLVSDRVITNTVSGLKSGDTVTAGALERRLLLLNDLPGVSARSTLQPGSAVGTSDLQIQLAPGPRFAGGVSADNYGNTYNGAYRLNGALDINNPFHSGDQISLRALVSDENQHYLRGQYELPVGVFGTRAGAAYSWMDYELAKDFKVLQSSGDAQIATAYVSQPWLRRRDAGFSTQLSYDNKQLHDETGLFGLDSKKRLDNGTLSLNGYLRDHLGGGGVTAASLGWTAGHVNIRDDISEAIDAATVQTEGRFQKWMPALQRQQRLGDGLTLNLQARGQLASGNLDSAEKISLGGAYAVRAYPEGEATGDEGWVANAELRAGLNPQWQLGSFADFGGITVNKDPVGSGDNHRTLSGVGLAAYWGLGHWRANAYFALPLNGEKASSDTPRASRLWAQFAYDF